LEGFRFNLETFLGLAMPNQYCQTGNVRLVLGDTVGQKTPNHHVTVTTELYDNHPPLLCDSSQGSGKRKNGTVSVEQAPQQSILH